MIYHTTWKKEINTCICNWNQQKPNISTSSVSPVIALSMKQRLGVTVQRLDWVVSIEALLRVIEGYKKGCLLNGIQRLLVLTTAEVSVTSICPWGPAEYQQCCLMKLHRHLNQGKCSSTNSGSSFSVMVQFIQMNCVLTLWFNLPITCSKCSELLFSWCWLWLVCQDPLHLLLYFTWPQKPAIIKHPHLEKAALIIHSYVFTLIHVLKGVWEGRTNGKERGKYKKRTIGQRFEPTGSTCLYIFLQLETDLLKAFQAWCLLPVVKQYDIYYINS